MAASVHFIRMHCGHEAKITEKDAKKNNDRKKNGQTKKNNKTVNCKYIDTAGTKKRNKPY